MAVAGRPRISARRLAIAGAWLALWQLAAVAVGNELLLAGPLATVARLVALAQTPAFWQAVAGTLAQVSLGFALGFALGVALGALAWRWPLVADILRPPIAVLRGAPIVCVIVLLLLWVGSRGVPSVASFLVGFPPLYFATREGLSGMDGKLSEMLRVFRVAPLRRALAHGWPSVVPYLAAAGESAAGMAWKAGVAAELIGTPLGTVGERVYQAKLLLETADLFAWTLVVIVLSVAFARAFVWLLRSSAQGARALAVWLARRGAVSDVPVPQAIELSGVTAGYGGPAVLENLSLACPAGSRTALVDESGAGKTTLLSLVAGTLDPVSGSVSAGCVSMVFQETRLVEQLSIEDNVALACGVAASREAVSAALAEVLPGVDPATPVERLSGGQRRRAELVRALLAPSAAVLLDEPFASLDRGARLACASLVDARLAGRTLLLATHDKQDLALLRAGARRLGRG